MFEAMTPENWQALALVFVHQFFGNDEILAIAPAFSTREEGPTWRVTVLQHAIPVFRHHPGQGPRTVYYSVNAKTGLRFLSSEPA